MTDLRWPQAIVASAFALDLFVFGGVTGPVRVLLALWFLLVCTGMSFVPLARISTTATELLAGVLVSLALDTVVATAIVLIGGLSATSGLIALETICVAGCILQLRRAAPELGRR